MRNNKILNKICILLFLSFPTFAQETTLSSGGNASATSGNVSYSVGQVLFSTHSDINASISEGVQQAHEAMTIVAIKEIPDNLSNLKLYPNPTSELIYLETTHDLENNLSYSLIDLEGKLLYQSKIKNHLSSINMRKYPSSVYFLKVNQDNREVKTFKIIKNQ